jgi:diacylglycerol kinase
METGNKYGLRTRINSFFYAGNGLKFLLKHETNFAIHIALSLVVIFFSWFYNITKMQWCAVCVAMSSVLVAEAFNTCIEQLVNLISPQQQPKAGLIKDIAAAAVLISAGFALVIAAIIFLPLL